MWPLELGWVAELWSGMGRVHAKADGIPKAWLSLLGADPNRYRHSPERLKKASQDEVSSDVHQGRRQSGKAGALWAERLLFRTLDQVGNLLQQHLGLALTLRKSWERAGGRVNGRVCSILPSTRPLWALPAHPELPTQDSPPFPRPPFLAPLRSKPPSFAT